jgi:hypothetical protein
VPRKTVFLSGPSGVLALLLAASLALGGCSGDDDPESPAGSTAPTAPSTHGVEQVATTATIHEVTGRLDPKRRPMLKKKVAQVVDRWLDAAYVDGAYPRGSFADAFPGFTRGAAADARHDRALMSNAAIGKRIDGVRAHNRRLRIDVLAVKRRAVGVTARFVLDFETTGQVARSERVKGLLYMTWHQERGWQVFGYDVTRGVRP